MERTNKGKSLILFPADYTVLDLETTGYSPIYDEIIEIAALKVRGGKIVDSFNSLVKPSGIIGAAVTEHTGITNEMLAAAPLPADILPAARDFMGNDIIVGHNIVFDINFLYDWFIEFKSEPVSNDFVDTLRLARKIYPDFEHHRLADISSALEIEAEGFHRALWDCHTTYHCFNAFYKTISESIGVESFINSFIKSKSHHVWGPKTDLRTITAETTDFDETHPLYGKRCVFTGTLEKMSREEAAQSVVNIGGICDNGVTKKTNFLILGNNDYSSGTKTSKHKKAEAYKLAGADIEIIPESVFYDMLEN